MAKEQRHVTVFVIMTVDIESGSGFELTPVAPDGFDQFDTCVALPPTMLEDRHAPRMMFQWHWSKRVAYD